MAVPSILKGRKSMLEPKLLHKIFEEKVLENPEAVAVVTLNDNVEPGFSIAYDQLNKKANKIAIHIQKTVRENQIGTNWDNDWVIGVSMTPSHDMIALLIAIWKSGAAYLPFETSYPQAYIDHILVESKPCLMIYEGDFDWRIYQKKVRGLKFVKFFELEQNLMDQEEENIPRSKSMSPDQNPLAVVVYIPHKSEPPKGVRLGHLTGQNCVESQWFEFPFSEGEQNVLAWSPLTSINHFGEIFPSLLAGKTISVVNILRETIATVSEVVEKFQVQRLNIFPSLLNKILIHISETSENKFRNVKLWINHGDVLPIKLVESFFDYFNDGSYTIANVFGAVEFMAETIAFKVNSKDQLAKFSSFPIGFPISNMRVYIMNEHKELVNEGEIGYINIAGLPVCDGFCNNRDDELIEVNPVSAIPMFSRLLATDDLGKIVDGLVYFEGRNDLQVKMNGYQIQVTEVETVFSNLMCLEKSLIEIYERGGADQAVLAFVILKRTHSLVTSIDIVNELLTKIPRYCIPEIYIVNQFPYTQSGKVNTAYLLKIHEEKTKKKLEKVKVEMNLNDVLEEDIEKAAKVFQIIGESIGNPQGVIISPELNFYGIGGNSLNTILCLEQLRAQNFDISLDDFLSAKNLREVLKIIEIRFPGRKSKMTYEVENKLKLYVEILNEKFKPECIKIIATAYCAKVFNKFIEDLKCDDIINFLKHNWNFFVDQEYSFMILDEKSKPVGVSLNFEVGDEPKESIPPTIESFLEFIRSSKNDIILKEKGKKVFESFMMATANHLSSVENIQAVYLMELKILKFAKKNSFNAIVSTDANQLVQQIHESILGYKVLKEFQVNRYKDKEGNLPFKNATDSLKTKTMWKQIDNE